MAGRAIGLAFGAREWIAYFVLRWWPKVPRIPKVVIDEPLRFGEVARYTVILGRRLLTYRLTKSLLAVFGPLGNAAARTSRGLNWHGKLEPYVPHHLGGFVAFSLGTLITAVYSGASKRRTRGHGPVGWSVAGLRSGFQRRSAMALAPDRDVDIVA